MKKMIVLLFAAVISNAWASTHLASLLNRVSLQLHTEQWVTTKTALVTVTVHAALRDQGVGDIQNTIMQKLNSLQNANWHIVSFERQQDQSGLESVQITAEARLSQPQLPTLRARAKAITKPGENYKVSGIEFVPSDDELRQAKLNMRQNIYLQVKQEVDMLNRTYPSQNYYVHQIDFTETPRSLPIERPMRATASAQFSQENQPMDVGNKQVLNAHVVIASLPKEISQQLQQPNSNL